MQGWKRADVPRPGDILAFSSAMRRDVLKVRRQNVQARKMGEAEFGEEVVPLYSHVHIAFSQPVDWLALGEIALIVAVDPSFGASVCTVVTPRGRITHCEVPRWCSQQLSCFTKAKKEG